VKITAETEAFHGTKHGGRNYRDAEVAMH